MTQKLFPLSEWAEEDGDVLWWKFPIDEPPWVGHPNCTGLPIGIQTPTGLICTGFVGGWPGYHTHWQRIEMPEGPNA